MGVEKGSLRLLAVVAVFAASTGLVAVSGFAGTDGAGGDPARASFRLEDGSAGCTLVAADRLVCRATGAETGAALDASGSSSPTAAAVDWDESTPVLLPAESWWDGPFRCRVRDGAISCSAGEGAISVTADGAGGVR